MKKTQKGFTFIDLLFLALVVVMLVILSAIFIPMYVEYKADMKDDGKWNNSIRGQETFKAALETVLGEIGGESIYFRDKKGNCWKYSIKFPIKDSIPCKKVRVVFKKSHTY